MTRQLPGKDTSPFPFVSGQSLSAEVRVDWLGGLDGSVDWLGGWTGWVGGTGGC